MGYGKLGVICGACGKSKNRVVIRLTLPSPGFQRTLCVCNSSVAVRHTLTNGIFGQGSTPKSSDSKDEQDLLACWIEL